MGTEELGSALMSWVPNFVTVIDLHPISSETAELSFVTCVLRNQISQRVLLRTTKEVWETQSCCRGSGKVFSLLQPASFLSSILKIAKTVS